MLGDPLVLAEDEPARQRGVGGTQARREPSLGATPNRIQPARHTAAPAAGVGRRDHLEHRDRAPPRLVALGKRERRHPRLNPHDRADGDAARPARESPHASDEYRAVERRGRSVPTHAQAPRPAHARTRRLEHRRHPGHSLADQRSSAGGRRRLQSPYRDRSTGDREHGDRCDNRRRAGGEHQRRGSDHQEGGADRRSQQPGHERRQAEMARVAGKRGGDGRRRSAAGGTGSSARVTASPAPAASPAACRRCPAPRPGPRRCQSRRARSGIR